MQHLESCLSSRVPALAPGTALLEYRVHRDGLVVFLVGPGEPLMAVDCPKGLEALEVALRWQAFLARIQEPFRAMLGAKEFAPEKSPTDSGVPVLEPDPLEAFHHQCLDFLCQLQPLLFPLELQAALAKARRLVIVPDGPLFSIPFHALYDPSQGYLYDLFPGGISYAPSATVYALCREKARAIDLFYPSLPILICIGDGRFETEDPERSWLEAAPYGRVTAQAMMQGTSSLPLPTRVLICLAGASARTGPVEGGERAGFPISALAAGIPRFLGTLWPMPRHLCEQVTQQVLKLWGAGRPLSRALRQAVFGPPRLTAPGLLDPPDSPLIWAPFCLWGSDE